MLLCANSNDDELSLFYVHLFVYLKDVADAFTAELFKEFICADVEMYFLWSILLIKTHFVWQIRRN